MRLIDADVLLEEIEESANAIEIQIHLGKCNKDVAKGMLSGLALVRENILRKPTAFDVDVVVDEIKTDVRHTFDGCINKRYVEQIVRKGGVDDGN